MRIVISVRNVCAVILQNGFLSTITKFIEIWCLVKLDFFCQQLNNSDLRASPLVDSIQFFNSKFGN